MKEKDKIVVKMLHIQQLHAEMNHLGLIFDQSRKHWYFNIDAKKHFNDCMEYYSLIGKVQNG